MPSSKSCNEQTGLSAQRAAVIAELAIASGPRVVTGHDVRAQHANTLTWIASELPDAVVFAESVDDAVKVVRVAGRHRVPIIAFGSGTSLEGHVNAPFGGISIDMSRMNRIVAVNAADHDAVVEAGVTREQLNDHLRDTGLFFSVDPGAANATLGGMAATRASGTNTVRYGTMRDNVLSLRAVMANGEIITTAGRARKSAAGYDLTHLLIGSEGTLGIIVELSVRLHPRLEAEFAAVCEFPSVSAAATCAMESIQSGCCLSRIELLDDVMLRVTASAGAFPASNCGAALFVSVEGTQRAADEHMQIFACLVTAHGGKVAGIAASQSDRDRIWKARHDAFWSLRNSWPGQAYVVTDVCVPISCLATCIAETTVDATRLGLTAPVLGHVGDGNFHAIAVIDPNDSGARGRLDQFLKNLSTRAIAIGGTCTGEHGIGQGKAYAMPGEFGPALDVMRQIKSALDPMGILNPGKIFPKDAPQDVQGAE
jgi:D-lactate dehydrogenase (cytochrome)